jgi:uncharacterized Zn-finger protein
MRIRATRSAAPLPVPVAAATLEAEIIDQNGGLAVLFQATEIAISSAARRRSTRLYSATASSSAPAASESTPLTLTSSAVSEVTSRNARNDQDDESLFDTLCIVSQLSSNALQSNRELPRHHPPARSVPKVDNNGAFACDQCDGRFSRSDGLARHKLRVHSGHLSHACDECQERFRSHQLVIVHKRICHSEEHPHFCSECHVRFARSDGLLRHQLRTHSAKPSHACEECHDLFSSKHHVLAHKRNAHSQDRPHACSECGDRFARGDHLYRHKRRRHDK